MFCSHHAQRQLGHANPTELRVFRHNLLSDDITSLIAMKGKLEELKRLFDERLIAKAENRASKQAASAPNKSAAFPRKGGKTQPPVLESIEPGMKVGPEARRYRLERYQSEGGMSAAWLADLSSIEMAGDDIPDGLGLRSPTFIDQPAPTNIAYAPNRLWFSAHHDTPAHHAN